MTSAHIISPTTAPEFSALVPSLHQKMHHIWRRFFMALLPGETIGDRAWTSALPSLREMDGRMLDDVGAPQWARDTVQRQRDQRARSIEQILGGRHGCASPRLDPLHRVDY